jgi:hypothetical protein
MGMINSFVREIPKLRAEENLEAVSIAAIGAGTMSKELKADILSDWGNYLPKQSRPKLSKEQGKIMLASMGIGVEERNN